MEVFATKNNCVGVYVCVYVCGVGSEKGGLEKHLDENNAVTTLTLFSGISFI